MKRSKKVGGNYVNYVSAAYFISLISLAIFFLFGLALTVSLLQSLVTRISSFSLSQILFLIIGLFIIYKPSRMLINLVKNKKSFNENFQTFVKQNSLVLKIAAVLSVVPLALYYSDTYLGFDFFVNVVVYLPLFLLSSLVSAVQVFLKRVNLALVNPVVGLVLPLSQVLYAYFISKLLIKLLRK